MLLSVVCDEWSPRVTFENPGKTSMAVYVGCQARSEAHVSLPRACHAQSSNQHVGTICPKGVSLPGRASRPAPTCPKGHDVASTSRQPRRENPPSEKAAEGKRARSSVSVMVPWCSGGCMGGVPWLRGKGPEEACGRGGMRRSGMCMVVLQGFKAAVALAGGRSCGGECDAVARAWVADGRPGDGKVRVRSTSRWYRSHLPFTLRREVM